MPNGDERPVAYASRSLTSAEQNYAQIESEALAIVFAVRSFHQYLYGRNFTLVTYHRPLCKILGEKEGIPPLAAARMQRWALLLSAYQYKIQYIPGKRNYVADCMSRLPSLTGKHDSAERVHSVVLTEQLPIVASQIVKASETDSEIASVLTFVQHGSWPSQIAAKHFHHSTVDDINYQWLMVVWFGVGKLLFHRFSTNNYLTSYIAIILA